MSKMSPETPKTNRKRRSVSASRSVIARQSAATAATVTAGVAGRAMAEAVRARQPLAHEPARARCIPVAAAALREHLSQVEVQVIERVFEPQQQFRDPQRCRH